MSVTTLLRTLGITALALAVAGCGGSAAAGVSSTPAAGADEFVSASAQSLVLTPGEVGTGWVQIPSQTKIVSLQDSMKDDSAELKKVETASYRSGYQTLYADRKANGILLGVFTYSNASAAQQVADG